MVLQELTPIIQEDKYILELNKVQYQEVTYALELLAKKRETAKLYQQKKRESTPKTPSNKLTLKIQAIKV